MKKNKIFIILGIVVIGLFFTFVRSPKSYYMQFSCFLGKAAACEELANMYYYRREIYRRGVLFQNYEKAARLYEIACDGGNSEGCNKLGRMYDFGSGIEQNDEEAARYYRIACDGEIRCSYFLNICYSHPNLIECINENERLFSLCSDGNTDACVQLGINKSSNRNYEEAVQAYRLACDGENMEGCYRLGLMYSLGFGVEQNDEEAARFYQIACDGGECNACRNFGIRFYIRCFQTTCNNGNSNSCFGLGNMYQFGHDIEQNDEEAARFYRLACDYNSNYCGLMRNFCGSHPDLAGCSNE